MYGKQVDWEIAWGALELRLDFSFYNEYVKQKTICLLSMDVLK